MAGEISTVIVTNITQAPQVVVVTPVATATPVPTVAPVLNPVLDIAPFHFTNFLWVNIIPLWVLIIFCIVVYLVYFNWTWMKKCSALSPCYGYKDALMAGSINAQQTIVFTKSRKWFIRLLTYHSEGILYFQDLLRTDMWRVGATSAVGTLGGLSAAITKDNYDEVIDPIGDIALCTVCDDFNHGRFGGQQNMKRAAQESKSLTFTRFDGTECDFVTAAREGMIPDSISNFADFVKLRPILEIIWPDGIKIPCYCFYDPYASDKFTPKNRSAALFGGINLQKARDFAAENFTEQSFWDRNGFAMILVLGALIILGASYLATR